MKQKLINKMTTDKAYSLGYDYGLNGGNLINCDFEIFSTLETIKEWERGKKDAEKEKLEQSKISSNTTLINNPPPSNNTKLDNLLIKGIKLMTEIQGLLKKNLP